MILATIDVTFVCVTARDNLSAGSWNIQEEIHRVRTKATEDILSSHRSMKHAPSTLEYNTTKFYLLNDNYVVVGRDDAINFGTPKPVTEIVTLDLDEGTPGLLDVISPCICNCDLQPWCKPVVDLWIQRGYRASMNSRALILFMVFIFDMNLKGLIWGVPGTLYIISLKFHGLKLQGLDFAIDLIKEKAIGMEEDNCKEVIGASSKVKLRKCFDKADVIYCQAIEGVRKIKARHNSATWMLEFSSQVVEARIGVDFGWAG
ncbi:hypothetical protein Tco_0478358 [Tanacetum coccineum]